MKWIRCCSSCSKGITNNFNKDILCRINGMVSRDYICSKYKAVAQPGNTKSSRARCMDCEFFILESTGINQSPNMGYCQLFTVRQFNGEQKKSCSKFCPKPEYYIS